MIDQYNISEAKKDFSSIIQQIENGGMSEIFIARNGKVVAKVVSVKNSRAAIANRIGFAKDKLIIDDDFEKAFFTSERNDFVMSERTKEMFQLVDMLPESEQNFISEMIKRVVSAWDPDFSKVTDSERQRMDQAEQELKTGEYVSHEDVWSFLEQE